MNDHIKILEVCMRNNLLKILDDYLLLFPEEKERQSRLLVYLEKSNDKDIINWNNFNEHIVAGGFIYAKKEQKFLVLYHKDLKIFLYPGGHVNNNEKSPLQTAKREIMEETGLKNLEQLKLSENKQIPIDIDTHLIEYNERLNLPTHYHFDFRYLFIVDKISRIKIEQNELSDYKWIDIYELKNDKNYGKIVNKIENIINKL